MTHFVIPGDPVPWARARTRKGRYFTSPRVAAAKEAVAWAYKAAGGKMLQGPIMLECRFYLGGRYSEAWKDARDDDNLRKMVADGLQGVAFKNDRQIVVGQQEKIMDKANPRTEVIVGNAE